MGHMIDGKPFKETAVFLEEYKGNKTIAIWEVDEFGDKLGKAPVISMGRAKAKAIAKHLDQFMNFVEGE